MVYDWFKRDGTTGGTADSQTSDQPPDPSQVSGSGQTPEPASAADAAPTVQTSPGAAASGVDEDALAWAREAYARLKAQQQAARQTQESAPAAPVPAATVESSPQPSPEAPAPLEEPVRPQVPEAPQPTTTPPQTAAPLSLLEQAAAERRQRQQELLASAIPSPSALPATPAPVEPVAELERPAERPGQAAAAPAAQADPEAEPQLGAFDESFTWSAEVLAAQGRSLDQVSLEEIDWLGRLRRGLEKTRQGFVSQLLQTLGDDPLTPEVLDELETLLLRADVGVQATDRVLEALRQRLNQEVVDPAEGLQFLKQQLRSLLEAPILASGEPLLAPRRDRLNVWLMVGVNGVGKTTTLGKLANLAVRSGYSCLIAAADTFRAAAVQQVQVWGDRSGVPVVANPSSNADPAAVVFDAIGAAQSKGTELVLVDTAGRLQTKHNLMEELSKVRRIVDRLAPDAVVESLLVLDASQGQNGLRQAMAFAKAAGLTGVVLTKLDGSARGGVALAVASEAGLPIRFVGAGEGIRDLRPFNSFEFVEALLSR